MHPDAPLREILSWRIMAELWRRFPDDFWLLETHPCDGMYDCLTLIDRTAPQRTLLDINREGSLHFPLSYEGDSHPDWVARMQSGSVRYVDEITTAIGYERPVRVPPSSPAAICFRYIAEFLVRSIHPRHSWDCRMEFLDTSGWGGGPQQEWFELFPSTRSEPEPRSPIEYMDPAYCYWFLRRDDEPLLCLDTDGRLHRRDGEVFHLPTLYAKRRRIPFLMRETASAYLGRWG